MASEKNKKKTDNLEVEKNKKGKHASGENETGNTKKQESVDPVNQEEEMTDKTDVEMAPDKLNEVEKKLEELTDRHLRLQAEFDNFKKRTLREKADLIKSGGESVIIGILPIIDDFERAIESLKAVPENDPGKQGTLLIYSKFMEFLKQNNVKQIDALNQDFDVDFHEALTKAPAPEEILKGKVIDVIQKGYLLNDKVIRYAKVVVGE